MVKRKSSLSRDTRRTIQNKQKKIAPSRTVDEISPLKTSYTNYKQNNKNTKIYDALAKDFNERSLHTHHCGEMNNFCTFEHCKSKNFIGEAIIDRNNIYFHCCDRGRVQLPELHEMPIYLKYLITGNDDICKHFRNHIREYNSAFAFASMGAQLDLPKSRGPYCFKIHGQVYHNTSNLYPNDDTKPSYAQLYVIDSSEALQYRLNRPENKALNSEIMEKLDVIFKNINPFAEAYRMMHSIESEENLKAQLENRETKHIYMWLVQDRKSDERRYNSPTTNEVAIVFTGNDGEPPFNRDICVHPKGQCLIRISFLSPNCDPMVYVIMFPHGEPGWKINIPYRPTIGNSAADILENEDNENEENAIVFQNKRSKVTHLQFYCYRLAVRNEFTSILNCGKLTQQYIVDAYLKIEANRLNFINMNQKQLRSELYSGLMDYVQIESNIQNAIPGKLTILPSSFNGSPRNMQQNYQDAMSIVREFGRPDLFITFTCNPKWVEITDNLEPWQSHEHRPDIVARVFNIKLKQMISDISEHQIFGKVVGLIYVIEFQKRGLPHCHMLIILDEQSKIRNGDEVDKIVCAEIPNVDRNPVLHTIISNCMIHGPCGKLNYKSPCMIDGKCSKDFPKKTSEATCLNNNGYPLYRRRVDGQYIIKGSSKIDNTWVVPYNPWLSKKYNAHINVEICSSVKSIKYLFKYVYKGHDCANIMIKQQSSDGQLRLDYNEVNTYMNSRYISAPEAVWRIFQNKMHYQSHAIIRLAVHLEHQQLVYFNKDNVHSAIEKAQRKDTTLMAWLKLNQTNSEARKLYYSEIPYHFVFNAKYEWKPRKQNRKLISRIYSVSPLDSERYFLRLLLLHVKGATSFESLRTFEGIVYGTNKEAAAARNLLKDDKEWDRCLEEAVNFKAAREMRLLFVIMCVFCQVTNAYDLYDKYKEHLCDDYSRNYSAINAEDLALYDIQNLLLMHGKKNCDFNLPMPTQSACDDEVYDRVFETETAVNRISTLTGEQRIAFDEIVNSIDGKTTHKCFFLDSPGGGGKSYLLNTLMHFLRGRGDIIVPCAITGIASCLLIGGRTLHSRFKLPLNVFSNTTSNMRLDSADAKHLEKSAMILIDEMTMMSKHILETIDRLLQEIMKNDLAFGGKVVLLAGDFRQTPPVVKHGSPAEVVEAVVKRSYLWKIFKRLSLTVNMRANVNETEFSEWLLKLGGGTLPQVGTLSPDVIEIPPICVIKDCLIDSVFGKHLKVTDMRCIASRAILCPKNDNSLRLNDEVLKRLEGISKSYYSIDTVENQDQSDITEYPTEFLNSLTPCGFPPHHLQLKVGAIIMLCRNLAIKRGLCNGTRLIVTALGENLITAEILNQQYMEGRQSNSVFIPRIEMIECEGDVPFNLCRRQFPIRLSFAMTINKSQGQTFDKVGIYLPNPVFSHGQLYVAFSRAKAMHNVFVKVEKTEKQGKLLKRMSAIFTPNVVFKEIL